MSPLIKQLINNLGKSLHDLVTSKKFIVAVMTGFVQALPVDQHVKDSILAIGGAFILGQGIADHGKGNNPPAPPAAPAAPTT